MRAATVLLSLWLALSGAASAGTVFQSGPRQVALLELYTSEGCSSCPPADAWFSGLQDDPALWRKFVPVAFHVDYWDYLGWKDPFARLENSARQRQYASEGNLRNVYTPAVLYQGREYGWHPPRPLPAVEAPMVGLLRATLGSQQLQVEFQPAAGGPSALQAHIAVLGFGLQTRVRAGENRSKVLGHDFVSLAHASATAVLVGGNYQWRFALPSVSVDAPRLGLAVWVSPVDRQEPIQSAGAFLP